MKVLVFGQAASCLIEELYYSDVKTIVLVCL